MFELAQIPLFNLISSSENILIAGAGGGFDIYSGIPLFLSLKDNKNIVLANLSFTYLSDLNAQKECDYCWKITPEEEEDMVSYFPEKYLSIWLNKQNCRPDIYAFEKTGVQQLQNSYQHLIDKHKIDTIILVDGGTDSLMFGDEPNLGTPSEDMTSIMAVSQLKVKTKILLTIGFGVDYFHGVEHYYFLENVAALTKKSAFYGSFSILPQMTEAKLFNELIDYVNEEMLSSPSIVANSIKSAINGEYGDYHATYRTKGSELWINPIMNMFWSFNLDAVAKSIKYGQELLCTTSIEEVQRKIINYRKSITPKELKKIKI